MIKQAEQLNIGDSVKTGTKFETIVGIRYFKNSPQSQISFDFGDKTLTFKRADLVEVYSGYIGESNLLDKYFEKIARYQESRICLLDDTIVVEGETCLNCGRR